MPVTCYPAEHGANSVNSRIFAGDRTPLSLLNGCYEETSKCKEMLQSTFSGGVDENIIMQASDNGFVYAATEAYSQHHHLVIRPDDIWITILTQLSLYVNANAEELRRLFVAHEGKKELVVEAVGNRYTVDFGSLARQMTGLLEENINDPSLRAWIMQDFTTTNDNDRVVMAISMMATLQKYFRYKIDLLCGIPSVTLLGERQDWVKLLNAAARILTFGKETAEWSKLLQLVLSRFVATFDAPHSPEVKQFWQQIAHRTPYGSGTAYLSGWITAFCFFGQQGKPTPKMLMSSLEMGGQPFFGVDTGDIPPAVVSVPVVVDDNGHVIQTTMVAGCVGMRTSSSRAEGPDRPFDTLQPQVGWWIFETWPEEK